MIQLSDSYKINKFDPYRSRQKSKPFQRLRSGPIFFIAAIIFLIYLAVWVI
ncbi:hypothetical protein HOK51_04475 [Candidatus Woesearchaeota archaeon]|jgi:hypothetical protein|nr:hypothetical protein [Candidatus Woesearchaeota archaeon]MBT7367022.1 hypothetical protein [Candidatus Woesearchaeota archaeon]